MESQRCYNLHSVPDHTVRHKPSPSNPSCMSQPWDPGIAPAHQAAMCPPNPLPKEWEVFYLLFTGNTENSPTGHVNNRHHAWKVWQDVLVWEWPAWFPSRPEMNSCPEPKEFRSSKFLLSGDPPQSFFLKNPYCFLLLSLKKKNFPNPRRWHIRVKNPIKEQ